LRICVINPNSNEAVTAASIPLSIRFVSRMARRSCVQRCTRSLWHRPKRDPVLGIPVVLDAVR
jgi:hypothetical protein